MEEFFTNRRCFWYIRSAFPLLAVFISLIFWSCKNEKEKIPAELIAKDKMIEVLVDIHIAEASSESHGLTSDQLSRLVAGKYDGVMNKHGITYKQFEISFDYYLDHPEQLDEIYQEVVNKLTALESNTKSKAPPAKNESVDTLQDSL